MRTWAERAKAAISQKGQRGTVKTDETPVLRLLAVSSMPFEAVSSLPDRLSSVLAVPSLPVLEKYDCSIAVTDEPDRWSWPHSSALNGAEIDAFEARISRFTDKGLSFDDGEALANKLVTRDRETDDRRLCLECVHLAGHAGTWGCRAWQRAGVAVEARDAGLPGDLVQLLQRCDGFKGTAT